MVVRLFFILSLSLLCNAGTVLALDAWDELEGIDCQEYLLGHFQKPIIATEFRNFSERYPQWIAGPLGVPSLYAGTRVLRLKGLSPELTRLEILRETYSADNPYDQLMELANPQFFVTGMPPRGIELHHALEIIYARNKIPEKRQIFPGKIFKDKSKVYHFVNFKELGQIEPDWVEEKGKIDTLLYFEALRHRVHPLSTEYIYNSLFRITTTLHEPGHLASWTIPRYNVAGWQLLAGLKMHVPIPNKTPRAVKNFFENTYEFTVAGKNKIRGIFNQLTKKNRGIQAFAELAEENQNRFLKDGYELAPISFEFLNLLTDEELLKISKMTLDVIDSDLIPLGGSLLDQFTFRSGENSDVFFYPKRLEYALQQWGDAPHATESQLKEVRDNLSKILARLYLDQKQSDFSRTLTGLKALGLMN